MPPKTKRLKLLQESARRAREGLKRAREGDSTETVSHERLAVPLLPPPTAAIVSDCSCSSDVSYDVRNEPADSRLEEFVEGWVLLLSHDDVVLLGLFLCFQLENLLGSQLMLQSMHLLCWENQIASFP